MKRLAVDKVNTKSQSNATKIQKFIILPRDFSLAHGELGPTLKLRRQIVNHIYLNEINELYNQKDWTRWIILEFQHFFQTL